MTRSALFLTILTIACGAPSAEVASPVEAPSLQAHRQDELQIPEGTRRPLPEVTLLEPGDAPLLEQRYNYQVGSQQVVISVATSVESDGTIMSIPRMTLTLDNHITAVDSRGWARVEARMANVEVDGGPSSDRVRANVERLIGSESWSIMCRRGFERARGGATAGETHSAPAMVFPREPIGVGARWQNRSQMESGVVSIATYTLRSVEGSRLHIDIEFAQSGDNVVLNGATGFVVAGAGGGQTVLDTDNGELGSEASITSDFSGPATMRSEARTTIQATPVTPSDN